MGGYNFKPQFERDIMADRKRHTIRAKRKHPDRPGSILSLYVGMRTKKCRLLKRRMCTRVQDITIRITGKGTMKDAYALDIRVDGERIRPSEIGAFARADGFRSYFDMIRFWLDHHEAHCKPFHGHMIHWESDRVYKARSAMVRRMLKNTLELTTTLPRRRRAN
jgi:hypothetical protein